MEPFRSPATDSSKSADLQGCSQPCSPEATRSNFPEEISPSSWANDLYRVVGGGQVSAASIVREALASVADDQDGAPPRRGRGGRMGRAGGACGRGAAPRYRCVRISKTNSFTE